MKRFVLIIAAAGLHAACHTPAADPHQDHLLQATTWYQQAAEREALYYQSFNWALRRLEDPALMTTEKPPAVVLDIDETVLDNSPQTAQQIIDGEAYSQAFWDEWCHLAMAEALPGALDFTRDALEMGVEVFYISNRRIHLLDVTIKNLREQGFPNADSVHVLLRTDASSKDARRERVSEEHEIALLIGDNLGDFSGIFDQREGEECGRRVAEWRNQFGERFILLPNPMYGSWEKPFRAGDPHRSNAMKKQALRGYRP